MKPFDYVWWVLFLLNLGWGVFMAHPMNGRFNIGVAIIMVALRIETSKEDSHHV